jgi:hypothetical protein
MPKEVIVRTFLIGLAGLCVAACTDPPTWLSEPPAQRFELTAIGGAALPYSLPAPAGEGLVVVGGETALWKDGRVTDRVEMWYQPDVRLGLPGGSGSRHEIQSMEGSWRSNGPELLLTLSDGSVGTISGSGETLRWARAITLDRLIGEEETFKDLLFSARLVR